MLQAIKRTFAWTIAAVAAVPLIYGTLIIWPDPLFAFSLGTGKIIVASDRPIHSVGGERFLRDCERLLERSPLKANKRQYRVYVTNENWRQRLFFLLHPEAWGVSNTIGFRSAAYLSGADFETGRVVHWGYVGTPPRTLAWLCAHELTHIIAWEHVGLKRFQVPRWVWEGFADYVGIENLGKRFEQLREALGDRPVDIPDDGQAWQLSSILPSPSSSRRRVGLLTSFCNRRLTEDEAVEIMRADARQ